MKYIILAAQSHVRVSFDVPEYTADITALGALRILESIRILNLKKTKYYQASSSEMYGLVKKKKSLNEKHHFIHDLFMVFQKFLLIILQYITEKLTEFLLQMVFYLIMSLRDEAHFCNKKNCSRFS